MEKIENKLVILNKKNKKPKLKKTRKI